MPASSFEREWRSKVRRVRQSAFWEQVSAPPAGRIPDPTRPRRGEVALTGDWILTLEGAVSPDGPASVGEKDLAAFLSRRLGLRLKRRGDGPQLALVLAPGRRRPSRWDGAFRLTVEPHRIEVRAASEPALLRACLYLSNYWSLRRRASLPHGSRRVRPAVELHLGADLWGGFCTTQAWIHGREQDDNFLELARMGVNAVPIMILLEDYLDPDPAGPFRSLANPRAGANRRRLARLARRAARHGVHIVLMGYNPKLEPDHPVFQHRRQCRGALQSGGAFRTMCTSDGVTRRFLVDGWAALFEQIPELGGIEAITGGEGFYHCFMRSGGRAADCPRCSKRSGSEVVAEFVNAVAVGIRRANPDARLVTWPYSAGHWSGDRDQVEYIDRLDAEHVIFQTEIDKDSVDWRPAGYAKNIWDYSMSRVTVSDRCRAQHRQCRDKGQPFGLKLQVGNSIECLNVPYLPTLRNQQAIWQNARAMRPRAIHSRWLFDGSCKGPAEELGYWALWGRGAEYGDLDRVLTAIAERDFGVRAAGHVLRAWGLFSEGMRHHPQLDYYKGSYFISPAQPLTLDPVRAEQPGDGRGNGLDPAFYGVFYWQWETSATHDDTSLVQAKPLFFARPGFRALARRGPKRGQDVALEELQAMADLWERGADAMDRAAAAVPAACRKRFRQERILGRHLAYTWRSAAHVEEFLRLRDTVREFSGQLWVRSGHCRENARDMDRMAEIAGDELAIARRDLSLIRGVSFLDLGLRLDMGTATTATMLEAKIAQIQRLLAEELPAWRDQILTWSAEGPAIT